MNIRIIVKETTKYEWNKKKKLEAKLRVYLMDAWKDDHAIRFNKRFKTGFKLYTLEVQRCIES